jgi:hypothetical protein
LALTGVLYVFVVHHGLGAAPGAAPTEWWHPTGFLLETRSIAQWRATPAIGIGLLTMPAALILGALYLRSAPALARAIAASATLSVAIMAFYRLVAFPVWSFFHWRGSVVMLASGLALGCCLAAPDLTRALLRRSFLHGAALYLPVFFVVAGLIRNATGWDPELYFNISPWPAIPVLALEIGAYTWAGVLVGLAVGVASFGFARTPVRRALGVATGVALPVAWFWARFDFTDSKLLVSGLLAMGAIMGAAVTLSSRRREALPERVASLGLAAALIVLPLATGRALAEGDYAVSKHIRARQITRALASYYEDLAEYPESLSELVDMGLLESVPKPRVGSGFWTRLGFVDDHGFDYQNLGSSYVLEFVSTEWIMCSYNPPWDVDLDEEEEEIPVEVPDRAVCMAECDVVCRVDCDDEIDDCDSICGSACTFECDEQAAMYAADAADDGGEAWSCPDARPELW